MQRLMLVAAVTLVAVVALGGCNSFNDKRGKGDAPVGEQSEAPRDVILMPDGFPNLVVACDGTTRIYVTTREAAPAVVPDHPLCKGKPSLTESE